MLLYDINFKDLFNELIKEKIHVDVIHSERSQLQRDNTVRAFRAGQIWVLICTELMGRGIDFKVKFAIKFYAITCIQCVTIEFRQDPVYVVNSLFSRCSDRC